MINAGELYIVATPIGNLEDITLRAISVLKNVKLIAAEDTRQSRKLLRHYGITTPLYALHAHNEKARSAKIIAYLSNHQDVAYITDAGTPLISDPGAVLVKLVREQGFKIHPIPGPCAAITALSISGWINPHFYFEGFLPHKETLRKDRLIELKTLPCTCIFYESPHRIVPMLQNVLAIMGNREIVLARELTKKYETVLTGKLEELLPILEESAEQRLGEFVVLVQGGEKEQDILEERKIATLDILLSQLPLKSAVVTASKLLDISKNELYELALKMKNRRF
jgi:16S rRNA (cytidine1402-2'-O)-methyltransferase